MIGIVMRRFLHFLFAIAVVFGATGAELRWTAEAPVACGCGCNETAGTQEASCPCGMPQRSSQPCGSGAGQNLPSPVRAVLEQAKAAKATRRAEPRPWRVFSPEVGLRRPEALPRSPGTDPPRTLDRLAQLSVFRI